MSVELSIILLDNSMRERFHTLDWLSNQTVSRDQYELIWVECHDRELEVVKSKVDKFIALHQIVPAFKHKAENAGIIAASGRIVTMCDADAVYPPEFVESVIGPFRDQRLVLMHYQERSTAPYPDDATLDEIRKIGFGVWPNVGACLSLLRRDAIGFGGVDEHESYHGLLCGPNELAWRMINSGVPEVWNDTVHLYHFSHPGSDGNAQKEIGPKQQHIEWHNLTAVEGFKQGRLLPLVENSEIHRLRMDQRIIGTDFEKKFAW